MAQGVWGDDCHSEDCSPTSGLEAARKSIQSELCETIPSPKDTGLYCRSKESSRSECADSRKSAKEINRWLMKQYDRDWQQHFEIRAMFKRMMGEIERTKSEAEKLVREYDAVSFTEPGLPRVMILGAIGAGKSTLANLLANGHFIDYDEKDEQKQYFEIGDGANACTKEVKKKRSDEAARFPAYIIDTPGLIAEDKDENAICMRKIEDFLCSIKKLSCFIICISMNDSSTSKDSGLIQTIHEWIKIWDPRLEHTIVVMTNCNTRRKRRLDERDLIEQYLMDPLLSTEECLWSKLNLNQVISMDNEFESEFGVKKLEQLTRMITRLDRQPMKIDRFKDFNHCRMKKIDVCYSELMRYKPQWQDLMEEDKHLVDSIRRKQKRIEKRRELDCAKEDFELNPELQCPNPDLISEIDEIVVALKERII